MTLGELIDELKKYPRNTPVKLGFGKPHSYRGYYEQLAFELVENTTIGEMLKDAESSVDRVFMGYKGGEFKMGKYTDVWLAEYGRTGEMIGPVLVKLMVEAGK